MMTADSGRDAFAKRDMQRRVTEALLFTWLVLTGAGWTETAWGEGKLARVGILSFSSVADDPNLDRSLKVIRRHLVDQGWIEGKNISYEYRNSKSDPSQIAEAAAAIVELKVDVIVADSAPMLRAAYAATRTIPIVASDYTSDPVAEGYIQSYRLPGGNVTGVFLDAPEFTGKWFELLKAMIPKLSRVAVLWDPAPGATHLQAVRSAARLLDIELQVLEVRKPQDIDAAFDAFRRRPQAVIILPSPMTYGQITRLARLALKHGLPATTMNPEFASAGGIIAYGPNSDLADERMAIFVAKILNGSKPAHVPVERPAKFRLVVNAKTAKALGITIPQSILLRADEVIR